MKDRALETHHRALTDYRIALGLELRTRRQSADHSLQQLASHSNIPAETLRVYERGAALPQLVRLTEISHVYGVSVLDILIGTASYIYRASGQQPERTTSADKTALRALALYCGLTPEQLHTIEPPGNPS